MNLLPDTYAMGNIGKRLTVAPYVTILMFTVLIIGIESAITVPFITSKAVAVYSMKIVCLHLTPRFRLHQRAGPHFAQVAPVAQVAKIYAYIHGMRATLAVPVGKFGEVQLHVPPEAQLLWGGMQLLLLRLFIMPMVQHVLLQEHVGA
jgi:hypothetical protein